MTQSLTKQEKLVLTGLVVCCVGIASFISNFQIITKTAQAVESVINYKMGKATEEISAYTLEGREINRVIEKAESEGLIAGVARKISNIVNKKTKKDDKKKTIQKAITKPALPNREFAKTAPAVNQQAVSNEDSAKELEPKKAQQDINNTVFSSPVADTNTESPNDSVQEPTKAKKTLEQIRAQFLAAPSKEAMQSLVASVKKNEVTTTDYYQLQSELLDSKNETLIGFALYGLRLTPSAESFTMMVQVQPAVSETYQSYIESALLSYNQSSHINILQTVIRSSDKMIVMKALQVAEAGINSIKSGNISQIVDNRNRRETTFSNYSLKNYLSLLPSIIQALASSQDADVTASLERLQALIHENVPQQQVAQNP